ncbi:unnamed protein product [Nezara viridula]|uniref:Uncharacterized protein n=1 Tax=Nezara viridula TaxID=85310 RepID=A0A9P0E9Z1_NEZVI|nr:unnamed protein product [Nezara viridula]
MISEISTRVIDNSFKKLITIIVIQYTFKTVEL